MANGHGGPATPSLTGKPALRARMRGLRDTFFANSPPPIVSDPRFVAKLTPGMVVASYHPVGSEADPAALVRSARDAGCRLALPHVTTRAAPIRFVAWKREQALAGGPFGLSQPVAGEEVAPDIILTPLLAFDRALNRLGQGAGHYDRAFAAHPNAWRLGVAWSVQQVAALPADPWDVPLHAVLTERDWITR